MGMVPNFTNSRPFRAEKFHADRLKGRYEKLVVAFSSFAKAFKRMRQNYKAPDGHLQSVTIPDAV